MIYTKNCAIHWLRNNTYYDSLITVQCIVTFRPSAVLCTFQEVKQEKSEKTEMLFCNYYCNDKQQACSIFIGGGLSSLGTLGPLCICLGNLKTLRKSTSMELAPKFPRNFAKPLKHLRRTLVKNHCFTLSLSIADRQAGKL